MGFEILIDIENLPLDWNIVPKFIEVPNSKPTFLGNGCIQNVEAVNSNKAYGSKFRNDSLTTR